MRDGEVTITAGGNAISGWQRVRIHRSCETVPNGFEVTYVSTETNGYDTLVQEGAPCTITIEGDLVLTGYVDVVQADFDKAAHELTLAGRGRCADLVDCTSEWPTSIINGSSLSDIARKLCTPYGISVRPSGNDIAIPQFGVTNIETPFAQIEEMCRYAQVLVYEDASGNLVLGDVGEDSGGPITWGVNVERARVKRSMAERYSDYDCYLNSTDGFGDIAAGFNVRGTDQDSGVLRHRLLGMVLEAPTGAPQQDFITRRLQWERARRAGRAYQAVVTVPGWRDANGALWAPNTQVPISLPKHGVEATWIVGDVTMTPRPGGGDQDGADAHAARRLPAPAGASHRP